MDANGRRRVEDAGGGLGGVSQSGWMGRDGTGRGHGPPPSGAAAAAAAAATKKGQRAHNIAHYSPRFPTKTRHPAAPHRHLLRRRRDASSSAGGGELAPARGRVRPELDASSSSVSGVRGCVPWWWVVGLMGGGGGGCALRFGRLTQ